MEIKYIRNDGYVLLLEIWKINNFIKDNVFLCFKNCKSRYLLLQEGGRNMAWYSLYKWFISFRKLPYVNIINWYRRFLYEEWFNSLTEEEQEKEKARIKGLKEKEMAGLQRTCLTLGMLVGLYSNRIY